MKPELALMKAHNQFALADGHLRAGLTQLEVAMKELGLSFYEPLGNQTGQSGMRDIPLSLAARDIALEIAEENKRASEWKGQGDE